MQHDFDTLAMIDAETFRKAGYQAVDLATEYLAKIRERPVFHPMEENQRQELLKMELANESMAPDELLNYVRNHIFPHPMGNGHPRFFGWTAHTPHPLGAIAELLAATLNPNCVGGDHAATYLELAVTRWLMELLGFPSEGSMGLLVSGGSASSLICLAAARHWGALQNGWNDREEGLSQQGSLLVLYQSDEGHSCIQRAAELLGLGAQAIRLIPTDDHFRMRVELLQAEIEKDRVAGLRPFCVVASAGTVNTGAIDPLDEIANLCHKEQLWLHVDGALGAVAKLDTSVSAYLTGLERAQSLAIDPHKGLSVPFECGCALVRDANMLRETFRISPPCLLVKKERGLDGVWFSNYGFQITRGFRALKLWMTLQATGRQGIIRRIECYNRLARQLAERIEGSIDFQLLAPVTLFVVCFRYIPSELAEQEGAIEQLNRAIVPLIQESGDAFISSTVLRGRFALRACILHDTTTDDDLKTLLTVVRKCGRTVLNNPQEL